MRYSAKVLADAIKRAASVSPYDPRSVLRLPPDADASAARSAFIRLAKHVHPDKNTGDRDCAEAFRLIKRALDQIETGWGPVQRQAPAAAAAGAPVLSQEDRDRLVAAVRGWAGPTPRRRCHHFSCRPIPPTPSYSTAAAGGRR